MKIKIWLQKTLITGAMFLLIALFIFPPEKLQAVQDQVAYRMTSSELQEKFYRTNIVHEIKLDITDYAVEEALREVANQTGLKLTYRWDKVFEKKVTLKDNNISVSEALDFILDGTDLTYLVSSDGYLLINQA
ncbi:MAG: STN domain-containing protein, partial [Balneolaceae bacterium]